MKETMHQLITYMPHTDPDKDLYYDTIKTSKMKVIREVPKEEW